MTATALPNRVQSGIPAGGQFAATAHSPADIILPAPAGPDFDAVFEDVRGKELAAALQALPKIPVRDMITASHTADLLRDSYPDYWADGEAPQTRADAMDNLRRAFPHLSEPDRERHVELIRFAVHTEMKSYTDPGYILHPDHPYEVLINVDEYTDEDDLLDNGHDENRQAWATLADTAAFYAINADNTASVKEALHA
jgi:hypothetical protein